MSNIHITRTNVCVKYTYYSYQCFVSNIHITHTNVMCLIYILLIPMFSAQYTYYSYQCYVSNILLIYTHASCLIREVVKKPKVTDRCVNGEGGGSTPSPQHWRFSSSFSTILVYSTFWNFEIFFPYTCLGFGFWVFLFILEFNSNLFF